MSTKKVIIAVVIALNIGIVIFLMYRRSLRSRVKVAYNLEDEAIKDKSIKQLREMMRVHNNQKGGQK